MWMEKYNSLYSVLPFLSPSSSRLLEVARLCRFFRNNNMLLLFDTLRLLLCFLFIQGNKTYMKVFHWAGKNPRLWPIGTRQVDLRKLLLFCYKSISYRILTV